MDFAKYSFYDKLTDKEREFFLASLRPREFAAGQDVYRGDCAGLIFTRSGRLCAYTLSAEGREITLYRLTEGDVCLFSASCALENADFDVFVRAETQTRVALLPADAFKKLSESSLAFSTFVNALTMRRFSDVMWVLDSVLNKKFDARLAALLLEERRYAGSDRLKITHERLAAHLGTVREAVSRMLKYFEGEGLIRIFRGGIDIADVKALEKLAISEK